MPVYETSVTVDCPQKRVYEFLLRPENIARISPPELGLAFTKAPEVLDLGSEFEFKVQAYGQVLTMVHKITELVHLRQITETQVKGFFGHWVHTHFFEANDTGQVTVRDRIDFKPPGGMLGLLVSASKILDHLDEGYHFRHKQLQKLLAEAG
jgi:ligand-binding SRPBCC domain-containing protein